MRGTKRQAQRVAAELTVAPPSPSAGRTVADALDAWLEISNPTWAISTVRDHTSRVSLVKATGLRHATCWATDRRRRHRTVTPGSG